MNVFVVYCHPSKTSFTYLVKEAFLQGLIASGHNYIISDLYEMDFNDTITEDEYLRETFYRSDLPVADDVMLEQDKIQNSDAIVFIYPVFWTEAPAKLVGWFDRVWSTGFAYAPEPIMKVLDKVLCIAAAGKLKIDLEETKEAEAMKTVMLGDRIRNRAKQKDFIILDGITHWDEETRNLKQKEHLTTAYELGLTF
ncbi:MAG: NAD(P)H-dependent oxidoreductase [bacterium]|nr:NAD(P)H-dependent oxidoreductase [bacterium]